MGVGVGSVYIFIRVLLQSNKEWEWRGCESVLLSVDTRNGRDIRGESAKRTKLRGVRRLFYVIKHFSWWL